ncbi:Alpha-monoglucosyldiacylglycerol synthase [termite gut metagenome]|uniref:Alpha-monoglucosyldiacylglycerol synthase n=1 Tax=termite gut metagenome TaxID=433724 RepID=A0A5J4RZT0_9ZZZZ
MKIFEIGTGYTSIPAKIGAATEIVVEELTRSMMKRDIDVTIVDIKDKNRQISDLPIVEVYMPRFLAVTDIKLGIVHKLKRVLYSVSLSFKLWKLVKRQRDDKIILHFHNQYNLFFFFKFTHKKFREKLTIAYTNHSYIWFGEWDNIKDIISKRYFQEVYCCRNADKVFVLNDITADHLINKLGVDKRCIVKIINGVNIDVYNEKNVDTISLQKFKNDYKLNGKKVILQVGSVSDRKNQRGSLELLLPILKKDKNIIYAYAGGIIDTAYVKTVNQIAREREVEKQVMYWGESSPGKHLNLLYTCSYATIVNSTSEAFSLVIAESMSASRPVLINSSILDSLFWEEIEGHGIIRIKEDFETVIQKEILDESNYQTHKTKGRDFIVQSLSWDIATEKYINNF